MMMKTEVFNTTYIHFVFIMYSTRLLVECSEKVAKTEPGQMCQVLEVILNDLASGNNLISPGECSYCTKCYIASYQVGLFAVMRPFKIVYRQDIKSKSTI